MSFSKDVERLSRSRYKEIRDLERQFDSVISIMRPEKQAEMKALSLLITMLAVALHRDDE